MNFPKLFSLKKSKYVLDENLNDCYGIKPREQYVDVCKITRYGSSDDVVLAEATKRNLLVITHDIRFVLKTLTKNQDIIYENHYGERFHLRGKKSKLIDINQKRNVIRWRSERTKKMLDFANITQFYLPMCGFYLVSVI